MKNLKSLAVFTALAIGLVAAAYAAVDPASAIAIAHSLLQSPEGLLAAGFAPTAVRRAIDDIYERKDTGGSGGDDESPAVIEIKRLIEDQGKAWKAFKEANDALVKAKADGKAVADLEAKLDAISKDIDKLADIKEQFDALMVKMQRPGGQDDGKDAKALAEEVKGFNDALRADYQSKGRPMPAVVTTEHYVQYKSAFLGLVRHGDMERLSADERKALSAGSDPDGGYLLPTPTIGRIVAKVYEQSIMRQLANVQPISTDALEGIVDNGEAGAGWVSETGTRSETTTPQVGKYRLEAHEMYAEPRVTQKLLDDAAVDIEAWLAAKVADKIARVEGLAHWRGNGVGQPRGLADYATAATGDDTRAWGTLEHIVTGANGDFHTTKLDPLQDMIGAMREQYLPNASWCMRREVRTKLRKLKESGTDRYLWEMSNQVGAPDRLLGYPVRADQYMPALATGSLSLAFGDFREAYTIVDRMGMRTLRDPFTAKPYVKFYTTRRTGGGCVNFEAVKFLKFST